MGQRASQQRCIHEEQLDEYKQQMDKERADFQAEVKRINARLDMRLAVEKELAEMQLGMVLGQQALTSRLDVLTPLVFKHELVTQVALFANVAPRTA